MRDVNIINLLLCGLSCLMPFKTWAENNSNTTPLRSPSKTAILLQSFANLEQFQSTEGNQIQLFLLDNSCQIKATFYGETGKTIEYYTFKAEQLLKAETLNYHYSHGGLSNLADNHGRFTTQLVSHVTHHVDQPKVQQDFKHYRALWTKAALQRCNPHH